jgi:Ser/Thr protein kinase RdoA (MazF antagonist)
VVLWEGEPGTPLSRSVVDRPALAHAAGTVLRALHAFPSHHAGMSDPTAEAAATRRATEHVTALRPSTGARLLRLTDRALSELLDLPAESGHLLHGDIKCDNLLVDGDLLRIVDLDRVVAGDPALDVGKLSADLRWWAMTRAADGDALVDAVLAGYGPCDPGRRARAACYDVLFQLRAAGRRVHLHEPSWAERVDECVELAERTWRRRR